jgi:hypothetical protein
MLHCRFYSHLSCRSRRWSFIFSILPCPSIFLHRGVHVLLPTWLSIVLASACGPWARPWKTCISQSERSRESLTELQMAAELHTCNAHKLHNTQSRTTGTSYHNHSIRRSGRIQRQGQTLKDTCTIAQLLYSDTVAITARPPLATAHLRAAPSPAQPSSARCRTAHPRQRSRAAARCRGSRRRPAKACVGKEGVSRSRQTNSG